MSNRINLKSADEIKIMTKANQIVADTLNLLQEKIKPGTTTLQLDKLAEEQCRKAGAKPAFKGYRGFPGSLCTSINEQVVHGIPSKKCILHEGDIISIDFGVNYKGYFGDAAISIPVGEISSIKRNLLEITAMSLQRGIEQAVAGNRVKDISTEIEKYVETNGLYVVKQFVGHGIGSQLHEAPEVPNYRRKGSSPRLLPGMVLAIEPMVNLGTSDVIILKDGWTVITANRKTSAHFEHSVLITENGPDILSKGIINPVI